jgi:tight adherence protein B
MSESLGALDAVTFSIALGALAAAALLIYAVAGAFNAERNRLERRLARLRQDKPGAAAGKGGAVTVRIDDTDSSIAQLDKLIKRMLPQPAKLRERLGKTGRRITLGEYVLANLLTAAVAFFALSVVAGLKPVVGLLFGVSLGLWLPHAAIGYMVAKRLRQFTALFPEAIELIVRGLKSGLPVTESIKVVGEEMADPIGVEFRRIADSFGLGHTLEQAMWTATKRLDTPEFRFFVISLSVQRETGGNLAETLENLANILRRRKQMKMKIRAITSEARASAYIIGVLPFLMFGVLTFLNPDYTTPLLHDPRGHMMLGAGLTSLLAGVAVMFKMASFEI